jgi:predicted deacetylase
MTAEARRNLVVSLHDVSPHTWDSSRRIVDALGKLGVSAVSLLVIPDHHHRGHFREYPEFCAWLRAQVGAGCEAVLHGYFHQRPARSGETLKDRFVTRSYTAGEGEFYDLPYDRARELVSRAREDFRAIGLEPAGFIAPAWLLSEPAEEALRDLGLAYTTRLGGVWNLRRGLVHKSQSLCWSVRALWRRRVSLLWNRLLFRRLIGNSLLRVAIHPVDLAHPRIWAQITRMIVRAHQHRRALTYEQWCAV